MREHRAIIKEASEFVRTLFKTRSSAEHVYHSFERTGDVVKALQTLVRQADLTEEEHEIVELAAWFHDSGFEWTAKDDKEQSVEIATRFLLQHQYPQERMNRVAGCIRAMKLPYNPQDRLEELVCDADASYLFSKQFSQRNDLRRLALETQKGRPVPDAEWLQDSIDTIRNQTFWTSYGRNKYGKRRSKILLKLQEQLRRALASRSKRRGEAGVKEELAAMKLSKEKRPERGVETMFRITSHNHITLSSMADNKAHIMISINTVLISIVVSFLIRNLDLYQNFIIPIFILLTVSLLTMIFAILVTRPDVSSGVFTKEDIVRKSANLLFFGNFHRMDFDDFEWGMKQMMNDREYLYGSMIKDLYHLGQVLGKKYRYLRASYTIFMYGLIVSVAAFTIAFLAGGEAS